MNAEELELHEILATLGVRTDIAERMLAEPARARACLRAAVYTPGIVVPAAYATALFQQGANPRPPEERRAAPPPPQWFEYGRRLGACR